MPRGEDPSLIASRQIALTAVGLNPTQVKLTLTPVERKLDTPQPLGVNLDIELNLAEGVNDD